MIFIPLKDGKPLPVKDTRIRNGELVTVRYIRCVELETKDGVIKGKTVKLSGKQVNNFLKKYNLNCSPSQKYVICEGTLSAGLKGPGNSVSESELNYLDSVYPKMITENRTTTLKECGKRVRDLCNCLPKCNSLDASSMLVLYHTICRLYIQGTVRIDKLTSDEQAKFVKSLNTLYNSLEGSINKYIETKKFSEVPNCMKKCNKVIEMLNLVIVSELTR